MKPWHRRGRVSILCAAALPAVLQIQQHPTVTAHEVRCSKPRCGALLELRVSPGA